MEFSYLQNDEQNLSCSPSQTVENKLSSRFLRDHKQATPKKLMKVNQS